MNREIVIIAHNIRSLWNIGSFFRTADAFGVNHIHLTGYTAVPPRYEIGKTALGADEWIPWSHAADPLEVIRRRREEGYEILALEVTKNAVPLSSYVVTKPMCLIVGHEITGVPEAMLAECDAAICIPMNGRKESLNVSVALGIALYGLMSKQ